MKARRVVVWILAIGVLAVYVWGAIEMATQMMASGGKFNWNSISAQYLAQGLVYAAVLVLLEGILEAVRREG